MDTRQENIRNSDLDKPKKKKNPEPGKQKPLTVEKEHVVEDPKKDKRQRIVSEKNGEIESNSSEKISETKSTGNVGLNAENRID